MAQSVLSDKVSIGAFVKLNLDHLLGIVTYYCRCHPYSIETEGVIGNEHGEQISSKYLFTLIAS